MLIKFIAGLIQMNNKNRKYKESVSNIVDTLLNPF